MVVTGGVGVLVVVAFVAGVVLNRARGVEPGDRVAVVRAEGAELLEVLAARCGDERVGAVEVRVPGGPPLWRIESERGGITRRFVLGADPPPFGFATTTPLLPLPAGVLEAEVTIDGVVDVERFDPARLGDGDTLRTSCDERSLGVVELAFVLGALGVVLTYLVMVTRYLRPTRR